MLHLRQYTVWVVPFLLFILLGGCAYFNINNQVDRAKDSIILSGMIHCDTKVDGPVIVIAYSRSMLGAVTVAHYAVLDQPGSFELMVGKGNYYLAAFIDHNRNLRFDQDEYAGSYGRPDLIQAQDSGIVADVDITIPDNRRNRVDFPVGMLVADARPVPFHSTLAGSLFKLDDPLYSLKTAEQGYWAPVDFFRAYGGNIYFQEPYDPARIPVLFVHGAMGSPENFRTLAATLDHRRFQAWFYYYPSGAGLTAMSNLLGKKVDDLQRMYGFSQLHVVAHSMGGLVARAWLLNTINQHSFVRTFISICSPWGGVESADQGVATSLFVLSSWRDIGTGSPFIAELHAKPLPAEMSYFLFFGYRGDRVPWKAYNDGSVTLQSQLEPHIQSEAKGTFGFNETHTGILDNPALAQQIDAILQRQSALPGSQPGSSLVFHFSGLDKNRLPAPFVARIIHQDIQTKPGTTNPRAEEGFFLNPQKSENQEITIPAGSYQIGVMAWGYKADPARQSLTVGESARQLISVDLQAISLLSVRIRAPAESGRPDIGLLPGENEKLDYRSIILEGNGLRREIQPDPSDARSLADHYLDYRDFLAEGRLVFFGLPTGTYRLKVTVAGFATQEIVCSVGSEQPGTEYLLILRKEPK